MAKKCYSSVLAYRSPNVSCKVAAKNPGVKPGYRLMIKCVLDAVPEETDCGRAVDRT